MRNYKKLERKYPRLMENMKDHVTAPYILMDLCNRIDYLEDWISDNTEHIGELVDRKNKESTLKKDNQK